MMFGRIESEAARAVHPLRAARKSEEPNRELLAQRFEQSAVLGAQFVLDRVSEGLYITIGKPHAARIVDQDADIVPLRHGGREEQHRPEETYHKYRQRRATERSEEDPVPPRAFPANPGIAQYRRNADRGGGQQYDYHREGSANGETAVGELVRAILEQELEKTFHDAPA